MKPKKQIVDRDDLLGNSPFSNQHQNNNVADADKEPGSGEWVDKLMMNKHDSIGVENPFVCWNPSNGNSDSSEPDLLWQFNNSKLGSFSNVVGHNIKKPARLTKSPELRSKIPKLVLSPSRKVVGAAPPQRIGTRQTTEMKRKTGLRK